MIQTGIKTKDVANFLKDYLSVIVIVPAFIGGVWQSIELMSLSAPYIRFFSISQIVPDGLLILFFIIIGILPSIFSYYFNHLLHIEEEEKELTEIEKEEERKKYLKLCFIIFVVALIFGIIYFSLSLLFNGKSSFSKLLCDFAITTTVLIVCNISLNFCYLLADKYMRGTYKLGNLLLIILYILIGIFYCKNIHNSFVTTNNLDNIDNITCLMKNKYPTSTVKIEYFNDKYLFIRITDTHNIDKETKKPLEKIHIMELEKLFND